MRTLQILTERSDGWITNRNLLVFMIIPRGAMVHAPRGALGAHRHGNLSSFPSLTELL